MSFCCVARQSISLSRAESTSCKVDSYCWLVAGSSIDVGAYDKTKPLIVDPVLAYSTYLGGSAGADCDGIAVDASGNAYVVGATPSTDFPVVNGYQSTGNANYVAFISKFDPTGATLLYSTYLGGTGGDYGFGVAL